MDWLRSLKGRADLSQLPRNLDQVLVKNKGRNCLNVQISCCITQKNFYVKVGAVNLLLRTLGGNAAFFRWWGVGVFSIIDIF